MTDEPDHGSPGPPDQPAGAAPGVELRPASPPEPAVPPSRPRPLIERLGLGLIALVFAALFGFVGVAAFELGEPFLGVMGLVGCLMTLWVGGITLFRR